MDRTGFSVVVPTFNEASSIVETLRDLTRHVTGLRARYDVQLVLVDDGSSDGTGAILRTFSVDHPGEIDVVEHERNAGLVAAMRTGAEASHHETVVFLDADLSYRPDIIEPLVLARLHAVAGAALASPYMAGGRVANVPLVRLVASRGANWLLTRCAAGRLHTFTGMVRAYDRLGFLALFTKTPRGEFNVWAVAMLLAEGRRIVEIPAALVWPETRSAAPGRLSMRMLWERMWLVVTTASVLKAALKLARRRADLGTLVLSTQPSGPYPTDV